MEISLRGYGNKYTTMLVENAEVGDSLDIVKANTASKGLDQKAPIGKLISKNGVYGLVETSGAFEFRYDLKAPKLGFCKICCDGKGGIKEDPAGREAIITEIDEVNKIVIALM